MNSKQRKRKIERRQAHDGRELRPRLVLQQDNYPRVNKGHIVPATFQRNFAVDGRVLVHPVGRSGCFPQKVENAGTQGPFYRRERPDGSTIDDVEASLAAMEMLAGPVLAEVAAGAPITENVKGVLTQFFALQMVRGPEFFSAAHGVASTVIRDAVQPETVTPAATQRFGADIDAVRDAALDALSMRRFQDMLGRAQKASSVLGCMRWQLLRFAKPVVAYSDQPVVIWPVGRLLIDKRPERPTLGPLGALEIRIPLSAHLIVLMTWDDLSDVEAPISVPSICAAETNALVTAQANSQWMHHPGAEPPIAQHLLRPLSPTLDPHYTHIAVRQSQRHRLAQKRFEQVSGRQFVNTVQLITSVSRAPVTRTAAGITPRRRTGRRRS